MLLYYLITLVVTFVGTCLSFNPREEIAILGTEYMPKIKN